MEESEEQPLNSLERIKEKEAKNKAEHLAPWQYKKGQSGNPGGRPIGALSMKTYVKNKMLAMTEEEREDFLNGIDKRTVWEMSEGKAKQDMEVSGEITKKIISIDE
jgi:hypothetical protein